MTLSTELASLVRAAAARIRRPTYAEEIRGEFFAGLRALMAQVPGGTWR